MEFLVAATLALDQLIVPDRTHALNTFETLDTPYSPLYRLLEILCNGRS